MHCGSNELKPENAETQSHMVIRLFRPDLDRFESFQDFFPPFLAASCTWKDDWNEEVLFEDVHAKLAPRKPGFQRFLALCNLTVAFGLQYIWCDSFCIDFNSPLEVSRTLRHIQSYYQLAQISFVYLPNAIGYDSKSIEPVREDYLDGSMSQMRSPLDVRSPLYTIFALRLRLFKGDGAFEGSLVIPTIQQLISGALGRTTGDYQHQKPLLEMASMSMTTHGNAIPCSYIERQMVGKAPYLITKSASQNYSWFGTHYSQLWDATPLSSVCGWTNSSLNQEQVEAIGVTLQKFDNDANHDFGPRDLHSSRFNEDFMNIEIRIANEGQPDEISSEDLTHQTPQRDSRREAPDWVHAVSGATHRTDSQLRSDYTHYNNTGVHFTPEEKSIMFQTYGGAQQNTNMGASYSTYIRYWQAAVSPAPAMVPEELRITENSIPGDFDIELSDWNEDCSVVSRSDQDRWLCFDERISLDSSLDTNHPLRTIIETTSQKALRCFTSWRKARCPSYSDPPQLSHQGGVPASLPGVEMKGKEFLEIACPFFKKDPSKYSECLKRHRLKKIEEVKEHLWQQHRIPFYCPICKRDFPTARGRDRHIVDRICAIQEVFHFEGVSDDQRRQLFRNRKGLGLNKQWFQLWKLLLPGKAAPSSPFIKPKDGLEVVMFREFWSFHGESLIAKSVKQADLKSWDRRAEERDLASLYTEVLRNVIDRIVNKLDITWKTSKLPPSGSG